MSDTPTSEDETVSSEEPVEAETVAEDIDESASGVGALLRASRDRCGEDLRDVANALRIRYVFLEAIESGRFEDLPGPTYAIGFVRAYADYLGLDSEEVVRRFKQEATPATKERSRLSFPTPVSETGIPGGAIIFVGVVLALVAYGAWYVSTSEDGLFDGLVAEVPERLATEEQTTPAPAEPEAENEPAAETPAPEPVTSDTSTPEASGTPETTVDEPEEAPAESVAETTPEPATETEPAETAAPEAPAAEETPAQETAAEETEPAEETSADHAATEPETPDEPAPAQEAATEVAAADPAPEPEPEETTAAETPAPVQGEEPASEPAPESTETESGTPAEPTEIASAEADPAPAAPEEEPAAENTPAEEGDETEKDPLRVILDGDTPDKPRVFGVPEGQISRIIVKAVSDSWVQISDSVADKLLLTRLLRTGDVYRVPDREGLKLLTGNAGALEILVDNEPVPPIGPVGAVRRDVALEPAPLMAGAAAGN